MPATLALVAMVLIMAVTAAHGQGATAPGLDVGEPRVTDGSGMPVAQVAAGEAVLISSAIASGLDADQPYVHIVRVDDSEGVTQTVTWAWGTAVAGGEGRLSAVWIPREAGEYEATVLLWESIDRPVALAPKSTVRVTVADSTVRAAGEGAAPPAAGAVVRIPERTGIAGCERDDECYLPPRIEVAPGTTVTWENGDFEAHTVTAGGPGRATGEFDSGLFPGGAAFGHTFEEAGEYPYYCTVHPWMAGSVVVGEMAGPAPPPPAPAPAVPPAPVTPGSTGATRAGGLTVTTPEGSGVPGCEAEDACFVPSAISVARGSTVTWENNDIVAHTVTSGSLADGGPDGEFDSGLALGGTTFEHTFDEAGEYPYFCIVHPWMAGTVMVGDTARPAAPAPPPTVPPASPVPPAPRPAGATVTTPEGSGVPGCEVEYTCFIPSAIEVGPGTTVTWENNDIVAHTVTSGVLADGGPDGTFDSGLALGGTTFEHTFDEAGEYPYFCIVHPWMAGTVTVR